MTISWPVQTLSMKSGSLVTGAAGSSFQVPLSSAVVPGRNPAALLAVACGPAIPCASARVPQNRHHRHPVLIEAGGDPEVALEDSAFKPVGRA
jgi:hypothetical protein